MPKVPKAKRNVQYGKILLNNPTKPKRPEPTLQTGAWKVQWIESESGWGTRPDGAWYYRSEELAKRDTARMLKTMRDYEKKRYNGATPSEYSYPEEPVFVQVRGKLAVEIGKDGRAHRERYGE